MKDTNAGTGQYLALTFQIVSDVGKGRKLWVNLNIDNPNTTAVAIAESELADICRAAGVQSLPDWPTFVAKNPGCACYDVGPLENRPMTIKVGVEKRRDTGEDTNRIKAYKATATQTAPAAVQPPDEDDLPF